MRAILPGRPQSKTQALCTALWDGLRIIAYLSGNAVVILGGPQQILQTIYVNEDEHLEAITIEEASGKIAVCGGRHVYIYQAFGRNQGVLRWSQRHDLEVPEADAAPVTTLSWGSPEELLVGGTYLWLWNIPEHDEASIIWEEKLANPVLFAHISHDSGLIASCGHHDRLVKIWRRLSYEIDSTRFDVSYLQHPTAVTNLHWRRPWHAEQNLDNLLYTFCADDRIRLWAHSDPHARAIMQFVAEIDMQTSIQPRTPTRNSSWRNRYGFVLDSRDFSRATEKAVQNLKGPASEHAMEHLIEVASRSPEICVVLDDQDHISAWGLENAGCKNRLPTSTFNVVHVKGMGISLPRSSTSNQNYVQMCTFAGGVSSSSLTILVHCFDGRIDWYDAPIAELFDSAPRGRRTRLISSWTGHDRLIHTLKADQNSSIMMSHSEGGQSILWKDCHSLRGPPLQLASRLDSRDSSGRTSHSCSLAEEKLIALVDSDSLTLWNVEQSQVKKVAAQTLSTQSKVLHILCLPLSTKYGDRSHMVSIHANRRATLWEIYLPLSVANSGDDSPNGYHQPMRRLYDFDSDLKPAELAVSVSSRGPGFSPTRQTGQSVLTSVSENGIIERRTIKLDTDTEQAKWKMLSSVETNISNPSVISADGFGTLGVVNADRRTLSLWDSVYGQMELECNFGNNDTIEKLSWTSTPHGQPVLAVGCSYRIFILGRMRYPQNETRPSWASLHEIQLRDLATHYLGDLSWLRQGNLVIGLGNQILIYDRSIPAPSSLASQLRLTSEAAKSIVLSDLVDICNATLPVFHPDFFLQLTVLGKANLVHRVLLSLHQKLKFASEGDDLSSFLDIAIEEFWAADGPNLTPRTANRKHSYSHSVSDEDETHLTTELSESLAENLEKIALWQISQQEQRELSKIVPVLVSTESQRNSVDEEGFRFLQSFTLAMKTDEEQHSVSTWRDALFAFHSVSQEILVDLVCRSFNGKLTWQNAQKSGMFLWLSDREAVRAQMEVVARNEYTKHEDRNPVDCSLHYIALGKKNVLQGLWRMVTGNREKENTMKLLANNFAEPRWKTTALKNAYVLLSKRRFEYAATFFLLGDSVKDAVNVCVHQLGQLELGIAIARVYEGDDGPVLRKLLNDTVLPNAAETGNRWMASWAYEMLGSPEKAIQALVRPLHKLISKDGVLGEAIGSGPAISFRANDPSLVVAYRYLRAQLVRKNRWMNVIDPKEEWKFVMRCVQQYMRMGCDLLALDLVRNWEFVESVSKPDNRKDDIVVQKKDPNKGAASAEETVLEATAVEKEKKKPPPTQFREPSASSLLDSFGF